jgi:hypothetical protein
VLICSWFAPYLVKQSKYANASVTPTMTQTAAAVTLKIKSTVFFSACVIKNPFFTFTAQAPCLLHALNYRGKFSKVNGGKPLKDKKIAHVTKKQHLRIPAV